MIASMYNLALCTFLGATFFFKLATAITIDSPVSVVQCQPLALNWHGSAPTGEIYISAVQGKDTSSTPLIQFTPQPATASGEGSLTWPKVNLTAGTQFTLIVSDATGAPNFSGEATVLKGSSTCDLVDGTSASGSSSQSSSGSASSSSQSSGSKASTTSAASGGVKSTTSTSSEKTTQAGSTSNTTTTGSTSGAMGYENPSKAALCLVVFAFAITYVTSPIL